MGRSFKRLRNGGVTLLLDANEAEVLRGVAADIAQIVAEPPDEALQNRLYPAAYLDPTEEAAEEEFRSLVHDDLAQARLAALSVITDGIDHGTAKTKGRVEVRIAAADEIAWLTALNDARLVLGTVLGVTEDEPLEFADEDPRMVPASVYGWLSMLQQDLIDCLSAELGSAGTDDP